MYYFCQYLCSLFIFISIWVGFWNWAAGFSGILRTQRHRYKYTFLFMIQMWIFKWWKTTMYFLCSPKILLQAKNFCQPHWWCCPCLQISTRGHWILAIANCTYQWLRGAKLHTFAANENAWESSLWAWLRKTKHVLDI